MPKTWCFFSNQMLWQFYKYKEFETIAVHFNLEAQNIYIKPVLKQVLLFGRLRPYWQTLGKAGKACQ
jgi:hypothetical protein